MTYFHYYATTSRNLDRVWQYGVFPLAHAIAWAWCKDRSADPLGDAAKFARWISAGSYAGLTSAFFGLESEMIDANAREAVSAEMGIEPTKLQFSDYKNSKNIIVSRAYEDILRLQKYRYGTDALFLLPTGIDHLYTSLTGQELPSTRSIQSNPKNHTAGQILLNGHMATNFSVLAGKAAYWAWETYAVEKTSNYEIVKLRENLQSTGKDLSVNDLLGVYQRMRTDRGFSLLRLDDHDSYSALRPLLQRVADAYNKHDGKIGIPEIVYLIGLNKINVYASDGITVNQEAITESGKAIDKLLAIGLSGIRKENQKLREMHPEQFAASGKSMRDHIADGAFKVAQTFLGAAGPEKRRPEEYITVRDPGELTNWNYSINR